MGCHSTTPGYPAPLSSTEFKPSVMGAMFEEGRRVVSSPEAWRTLPPGVGSGESVLSRAGPRLTFQQRGPLLPIRGPRGLTVPPLYPVSDRGAIPTGPLHSPAK